MNLPYLSLIVFIPLVGALFIALFKRGSKGLALFFTLISLVLSAWLFMAFDRADASRIQFEEKTSWLPAISSDYHLGVDGLSLPLVLLTALL